MESLQIKMVKWAFPGCKSWTCGLVLVGKLQGELCCPLAGLWLTGPGPSLQKSSSGHRSCLCWQPEEELPKAGREEEASQKKRILIQSKKKKGTQFEGNWNFLTDIAIPTKPVSRLGMLLCLEEQGGFFACVYELGFLLLLSYPLYPLFFV